MPNTNELLEELKSLVFSTRTIVSCPSTPAQIQGITAADALDANDCLGNITVISVPKAGIIWGGTWLNLNDANDNGIQVDLEIFKASIAQVASDSAYAPTAGELLSFIYEMRFFAFDDHGSVQTSTVENIGKAYTAPGGKFYIQAVTRGTPTIAVGCSPRFQLQIQSFDPEFVEA